MGPPDGGAFQTVATELAAPRPELRFTLSESVHALELEVAYPTADIWVHSAYAREFAGTMTDPPLVWIENDGPNGVALVSVVANGSAVGEVSVVFTPKNGTPLPGAQATPSMATIHAAYDADGVELPSASVSDVEIY